MSGIKPAPTMRTDRDRAQRVLLRARAGDRAEPGVDAAIGRAASGVSGVWQSALDRAAAARRLRSEPEAGATVAAGDGGGGGVSAAGLEPAGSGTPDLPVSVNRRGNQRSGPGVVERHYVCANGLWVHVFGGGDGLVEPLCGGVGVVQQPGQRVLHPGVDERAGQRTAAADLEHRPGQPIHQRGVCGGGGSGRGGREHGWAGPVDRQPLHRAAVAQRQAGGHLSAGLCRWLDGATRVSPLVYRVQSAAATSGAELCNAGRAVSCARVVWGQAGRLAVAVGSEAHAASSPPFAPPPLRGCGAHSGLDAGASVGCNGLDRKTTNNQVPAESGMLTYFSRLVVQTLGSTSNLSYRSRFERSFVNNSLTLHVRESFIPIDRSKKNGFQI